MGVKTAIKWCDHTWNPWRGCTKVSDGCTHCYAEKGSLRNPAVLGQWGPNSRRAIAAESYWDLPHKWNLWATEANERRRVFSLSYGDFMELRDDLVEPRERVWETVRQTGSLDYLLLTKRPQNWRRCWPLVPVPGHIQQNEGDGRDWEAFENVWLGVSVENRKDGLPRVDILRSIPAVVRFLSIEPLLEDLGEIDLTGIHWVIVGGESGPKHRPMDPAWARSIRDQCAAAGVAYFFKQSSGPRPGMGEYLDGRLERSFPQ